MRLKINVLRSLLWFIFECCVCVLHAESLPDSLRVQVTNTSSEPLFGVYVVNPNRHYLVTTTDEKGYCCFSTGDISLQDSIRFSYLGYKDSIVAVRDLVSMERLALSMKMEFLQEVNVVGIKSADLLEKVMKELQPVSPQNNMNFYGKAQYAKITTCFTKAVEYRREFGFFLTSGHVKQKEKWDLDYKFEFIPVYSARSFNLLPDRSDTLRTPYIESSYNAESKKIFPALRAVFLWGPLFSKLKYYDIQPIESDSNCYKFVFSTREKYYPQDIKIFCKGVLYIDRDDFRLRRIEIDYLDYHFYRLTNLTRTYAPFSTKMQIELAYNEEGDVYVHSCRQETVWKHKSDQTGFGSIEMPSRRNPEKNRLVETEAFQCMAYQRIPAYAQMQFLREKAVLVASYPFGIYDTKAFEGLPDLLDSGQAIADLSEYKEIEAQFLHHGNKPYYPRSYLTTLRLNGITPTVPFVVKTKNGLLRLFFK
ncbi:hypothetical protein [Gabonibacter massiliensis]|uniref:hypothetical protein n=1 Tax=Gabonibacter massiliensis TaxID=1720195 RepID=UPI00073F78EE|nr:hypothetical protein [Gabonibacter massiliensis]